MNESSVKIKIQINELLQTIRLFQLTLINQNSETLSLFKRKLNEPDQARAYLFQILENGEFQQIISQGSQIGLQNRNFQQICAHNTQVLECFEEVLRDPDLLQMYIQIMKPDKGNQINNKLKHTQYIRKFYTASFNRGLNQFLKEKEDRTPKQIAIAIQNMDQSSRTQFWKCLACQFPQKTKEQYIQYFNTSYKQELYDDRINSADVSYIQQYCELNKHLSVKQIKKQLQQVYFKDRNIFQKSIHTYVDQTKRKQQNWYWVQQRREKILRNNIINYQIALQQLFNQDFSTYSSKKVVEYINSLNSDQLKLFWNKIHSLQPQKRISECKRYFQTRAQQYLFQDRLTLKDKQYIKIFCQKHTQLSLTQATVILLETQFKNRNIFYWELYTFIGSSCKPNIQFKTNQMKRVNQKIVLQQELIDSYTQIYKQALAQVLEIDALNYTPVQICQVIDTMNDTISQKFWKYIGSSIQPKNVPIYLTVYYRTKYRSVLFNNQLTQEDKEFISKLAQTQEGKSLTEIAKSIFNQYYANKSIFYYDVYRTVQNNLRKNKGYENIEIVNQLLIDKEQRNSTYQQAYTKGLTEILGRDCSSLTNKEICEGILNLDSSQSISFWKFVTNQLKKKTVDIKNHFKRIFSEVLHQYNLTKEDIKYIEEYCEQNIDLTVTEVIQFLKNDYFQQKDVFYWDIYNIVDTKRNKILQKGRDQVSNTLNQHQKISIDKIDNFTKWAKLALLDLKHINEDQVELLDQKQICIKIDNLIAKQKASFWKTLQSVIQPQKSNSYIHDFYNRVYRQALFQNLSKEDAEYIKTYCYNNRSFTQQQIIQHCQTYLDKNINLRQLSMYVTNYRKRIKQSDQQY
ncbi:Conserved_hypothetical protein [Hexamita inflata]|uniref:Uncharacterized protein n=1 Tax=Hexamita inflata TaxID=28002 RepID=A0AA86P2U4_9EUKA|nr:Conserved hypothetical protein [Hexamita inflata]CAI9947400.1 Conserved hypothetical protein [Hexamita inflata]